MLGDSYLKLFPLAPFPLHAGDGLASHQPKDRYPRPLFSAEYPAMSRSYISSVLTRKTNTPVPSFPQVLNPGHLKMTETHVRSTRSQTALDNVCRRVLHLLGTKMAHRGVERRACACFHSFPK